MEDLKDRRISASDEEKLRLKDVKVTAERRKRYIQNVVAIS